MVIKMEASHQSRLLLASCGNCEIEKKESRLSEQSIKIKSRFYLFCSPARKERHR